MLNAIATLRDRDEFGGSFITLRSKMASELQRRCDIFINDEKFLLAAYFDPRLRRLVANKIDKRAALRIINSMPEVLQTELQHAPIVTVVERKRFKISEISDTSFRSDSPIERELEAYESPAFSLPCPDAPIDELDPKRISWGATTDVYTLWRNATHQLPVLAKAAQAVFTIPASFAEIERVFSTSSYNDSARRHCQMPAKIRRDVLVRQNFRYLKNYGQLPFNWAF